MHHIHTGVSFRILNLSCIADFEEKFPLLSKQNTVHGSKVSLPVEGMYGIKRDQLFFAVGIPPLLTSADTATMVPPLPSLVVFLVSVQRIPHFRIHSAFICHQEEV